MSEVLHDAFIGLGSNLGRRDRNIAAALNALESTRGISVIRVSSLYETRPEGGPPGQGPYLNGAAHLRTSLTPERLLSACTKIEALLGRTRDVKWGPRTIDIDLLAFDREIRSEPDLMLPHPLMHERVFVMRPLAEIAPDWIHPLLDRTAREILDSLGSPDLTAWQ